MATNSSILTWQILWTEEPSRLRTVHGVAKESDTTYQLNSNNKYILFKQWYKFSIETKYSFGFEKDVTMKWTQINQLPYFSTTIVS